MKISFTQAYITPGINFPFSHHFQKRISNQVSSSISDAQMFYEKYGQDFSMSIYISAENSTVGPRVVGPGVYRKGKEVEYTIFLPFDAIYRSNDSIGFAIEYLFDGIEIIMKKARMETRDLDLKRAELIHAIRTEENLLAEPWPMANPAFDE